MDATRGYLWSDDRIMDALVETEQLPNVPSPTHALFAVMMTLRNEYEAELARRVPANIPTEAIRYLLERAWLTQAGRTDLIRQVIDWLGPEGNNE